MKKICILTFVAALAASFGSAFAGDITGKITLKGTPPKEKDITPLKDDPGVSGKSTGASAAPAVLDQKSCEYVPQIFALQTGQKMNVKNSDPVLHNIHTQPTVAGNKEDNKAQMPGSPDMSFTFDKAEMFVKFKCDVHPWMFAWVSVFDHPYFAVSAKDGTFKIANVPAGKYTLEVAHRKAGTAKQEIEVKDGEATKVELALEVK
jgi:plastocyanin